MKLHLPKRLFTALLTAITLAAAPAALTLGSAAWGDPGDVNNLDMGTAPGGFYGGNYAFNFQIGEGDLGEGDTSDVLALYWGKLDTGNLWSNGFTLGPLTDDGGVTLIVGAGKLTNAGTSGGSAEITDNTTFTPDTAADRNKTFRTSLQTGKTYTLVNVGANQNQTVMLLEDGVYKETVTYNGNMHGGVTGTVMGSVWNKEYDPSNVQVWNGKGETAEFLKANFVGGATQLADSDLIFAAGMTDVVTTVTLAQDTSAKSISVYDNYTFATTGATADVKLSVTDGITVAAGKTLTLSGTQTSALVLDSTINDGAVKIDGTVKAGSNLVISDNGSVTVGDGSLLVLGDILTHNNGALVTEGTGALTIDRGAFFANVANATLVSDTYYGGAVAGNGFLEYEVDILEGNDLSDAISVQTITSNGSETVQTTTGIITTLGSTYYINSGTETYRGADNTESGDIAGATGFVVQNGTLKISKDGNISTIKSLDIRKGGEVCLTNWNASLGSANSLVDVTLSDGGIFSFSNGHSNSGGGKMYLNLTVNGSGTLGGSANGHDSNVYGTVQGHGVLTLAQLHHTNIWTVAAAISDDAKGALALNVTSGNESIILSGANTYTGGTTIASGALLKTNHATALGTGTVTLKGGTLALQQGLTISALSSTVAESIVKSEANATLTVSSGSYAGVLQNGSDSQVLSLTKTGAGTLTLSGANTYTGTTTINGGVLEITNTSALGTSSTTIAENASLRINTGTGSTITFGSSNRVTGAGTLEIASGSTVEIGSSSNGTAHIQTNVKVNGGGTLKLTAADALGWGGSALKTITLLGSGAENGQLAKLTATGVQTMKTSLDLQGNAEVSGGAFEFYGGSITVSGKNNVIKSDIYSREGGTITVTGLNDVLEVSGNFDHRSPHQALITKSGLGLLKISGASNTFYAGLTVAAGKVEVAGTGSTNVQGAALTVSSGAEFEISAGTSTLSDGVTNSGSITVSGGTADFSSAVTNTGAITVSGGTADFTNTLGMGTGSSLSVSGGSATVSGALNVTGSGVQIGQSGEGQLSLLGQMSVAENAAATLSGAITLGHTITNDGTLTLNGTIYLAGDIDTSYEHRARGETSYALADSDDSNDLQNGFMTVASASYYLTQSSYGVTAENTMGNKVVYHGGDSYIVYTDDSKGLYFSTGESITGTQYYITTGGVVVNNAVQTAATGYTLQGGTMQLTEGSVNTSTITYTSGSITLSDGATLVLDAMPAGMTANSLLSGILSVARDEDESTQIGRLKITQETTLTTGFEATYTGAVEINGTTLKVGTAPGNSVKLANIRNFILNDGGELYYHANPSQAPATVDGVKIEYDIQKITVESGTGSFKLQDSDAASLEIGEISINEDATFKFWSNWYDSDLNISALNGAGTFRVESSDDSAQSSKVDIDSLAGFTGSMEFVNDTARNLAVTIDTGDSAVNFKSLQTINTEGTAALTLNVQADTTIGLLSAASGTVNVAANKTLTLGGGTAEAQAQHSIGTLSAAAAGVTLGDHATLVLGGGTDAENQVTHNIGTLSAASAGVTLGNYATLTLGDGTHSIGKLSGSIGSKLNLSENAVLNQLTSEPGPVTVTGSGTYIMGDTGYTNLTGWTDAVNWKGTVVLDGMTLDGRVDNKKLHEFGNAESTVRMTDVKGWFWPTYDQNDGSNFANAQKYAFKLELVNGENGYALQVEDGSSNYTTEFSGEVSGSGNLYLNVTSAADNMKFSFSGNIGDWTADEDGNPEIKAINKKNYYINLTDSANEANVAFNRGNGTLNLTVATDAAATFNNTIDVNTLTLNQSATFNANTTASTMDAVSSTVTLGDNVTLALGAGTSSTQMQHSIGTLTGGTDSVVNLGNYATLSLGGGTDAENQVTHSIDNLTGGTGSKLNLAQHSVLNTITRANGVTLSGQGRYNAGSVRTLSGIILGEEWTGSVYINDVTGGGDIRLDKLGRDGSTVVIGENGVSGYFQKNEAANNNQGAGNTKFYTNLQMDGNVTITDAYGSATYEFLGDIAGDGSFEITRTTGSSNTWTFKGDIKDWNGGISQSGSQTTNLVFAADASSIKGAINGTSGTLNLQVNTYDKANFSNAVTVSKLEVQQSADFEQVVNVNGEMSVSSGKTATFNNTATANTVTNNGQIKLGETATITGKQGAAATMSKVQMSSTGSSTGITGTAQDGSSSMSNADIEVLAQDATFTIADMTLTNTSINAATVNTQVSFDNVTVSGAVVLKNLKVAMSDAQVGAGGSDGSMTFTGSTTLLSGITMSAGSSLTVDLGDLSSYAAMGPGKYNLSITLSGFSMGEYTGDYANSALQFAAGSWLSELLAQDNNANVQISITQAEEGAAAAAAGVSGGSTGVSYSTGNVGMVITITGLNVPEPTTATLSLLALAALAGRRRRK